MHFLVRKMYYDKISLKFVPRVLIDDNWALVEAMFLPRETPSHYPSYLYPSYWLMWGFWHQKQVPRAGVSNYIPQNTVEYNYLFLPEIPISGPKVIIYASPGVSGYELSFINSSPPSAAYMRQWIGSSLVRVMACRLFGAKPLPELMLTCWTPGNKFQWNLNRNSVIFIQENAFEIDVCQHGGHFVQVGMAVRVGYIPL